MEIILASSSPRRHELLTIAGVKHTVISAEADETIPEGTEPQEAVMMLSKRKMAAALASGKVPKDAVVITADTIVFADGMIFGKPKDDDDARRMLEHLSNDTHEVYTGVTVTNGDETFTEYEVTHVTMTRITKEAMDAYLATGQHMGKAGAYAIQGYASRFVRKIDGDYTNVVGLPVPRVLHLAGGIGGDIL